MEIKNEYQYEFDDAKRQAVDLNSNNRVDLVDLVKVRLISAEL